MGSFTHIYSLNPLAAQQHLCKSWLPKKEQVYTIYIHTLKSNLQWQVHFRYKAWDLMYVKKNIFDDPI